MAVLLNPESPFVKEMAKWEQFPSEYTIGGNRPGNPYTFRPYPRMMFMARQTPSGKWDTALQPPAQFGFRDVNEWDRACMEAQKFTESCQRVVNDETEHKRAKDEGWRDTPTDALDFRNALEKAVGDAAAERNFRDRNMSEKAKEEVAQVEAETFGHLAEIPEAKKRGRPRKE